MKRDDQKILLIDDELDLLEMVGEFLKKDFSTILKASSGQEGLKTFESNPDVKVVVCDINMPEMKGLEVIEKIRDLSADVPFIFFTGFGSRESMLKAASYGAFDFIEKPNIKELMDAVNSAVIYHEGEKCKVAEAKDYITEYKRLLKDRE